MIRVVTDSSADLPPELVERLPIDVLPHRIRFGDESLTDESALDAAEVCRRLAAHRRLPEIVAPTAAGFTELYRRLADDGASAIVAVCTSSAMSATYEAAVLAAEATSGLPVRVVDSHTASMALGLPVIHAAELAADGARFDEVAAGAATAAETSNLLVAVDSLDTLRRNRLIGPVGTRLGSLLDIKPLITFEGGAAVSGGRVRGREAAIAVLAGRLGTLGPRLRRIALLHTDRDGLEELGDAVAGAVPWLEPVVAELGATFTTQTGPGALGVAYQLR